MRITSPRLWIAILSAAGVLYVTVGWAGRESPGPLAAVHARAPDLTGFNSCAECHGGWFGDMTGSCLECHEEIGGQIGAGKGLHGALGEERAAQCARCHSDHHGAGFAMVNAQSFREAGVPDRDAFDHARVGYAMGGRHLELACAKCHANADVEILPEGGRRYGGLEQDCAKCHEDFHKGTMAALACAQCHGQESFKELHSEGHEKRLPLVGGHGDLSCRECHAAADPLRSLEALGSGRRRLPPRECRDCHDSPHREGFVASVAALRRSAPGASCVVCHEAAHTSFRDERLATPAELHACSGFPLDAPHDKVACAECHAKEPPFAERYPGRGPDACAACHEDPHGGQFEGSPFAANGCLGCHDRLRFEPHAFGPELHAQAALPLTGRHLSIECAECHKVAAEGVPRAFAGTPARCEACHEDAHRGFFGRLVPDLGGEKAGTCARCHVTTTFREMPAGGFDHGRDAGFAVEGAHAQAACESCHPRAETPDETGRTLGRVAERFGRYAGCATCHKDPHEGAFDAADRPKRVGGRIGCARCHVETSFRSFPEGFDHQLWTGFPVDGAHEKAGCAACHAPLRKPDAKGRTWGRAKGSSCAACHADPHAGQFRTGEINDCQRCHRSATSFSDLAFRHNFDSRFRLDKDHAGVACSACHKKVRVGGIEVVRYRPLGRECADCHEAQRDPLSRRGGGKR